MERLSHLPPLTERQTASDYVGATLREAIITGQFEDGEELNQVELASHFNVSRVPVREALRSLQAEGLVSAEAHHRATVVAFTPERIREIFEIRAMLEAYMIGRAAPRIDAACLADLSELCEQMDGQNDRARWLERNHAFHAALLRPSGATTALALVDQLSRQVQRYGRRTGGVHRPKEAGREHREIVAALRNGDAGNAMRILERHILHTRDRVLDGLPKQPA